MKRGNIFFIVVLIVLIIPINALAHPGRTDSNGCHTCRTNCSKWGLRNGQYHCHNGGSSSSSSGKTTYTKSSVKTLSSLRVDGTSVSIKDKMNITTTNKNPSIVATPTNSKASVSIANGKNLKYGNNEATITVTAENGSTKKYKLNIKLVSDDATLKSLKVGSESIDINGDMSYKTIESNITIVPVANNENATITYQKNHELKEGKNEIKIKVVAEDGKTTKEYILNVTRVLSFSDNVNVRIYVNGENVTFNNYKSNTINLSSDAEEIDIEYKLEDENAKIELDYDKKIATGDTTIKFKVISESGKEQEYEINIHKYSESEENVNAILGLGITGGIGYGIYRWKKRKNNK